MHTAQSVPHSARRAQRAARAPGCLDNQVSAWRAARAQPPPTGGAARRATPTAKRAAKLGLAGRLHKSAVQLKNGKECACSIILPSGHIVQASAKRDRPTTLCAHSVRALLYSTLGSYSTLNFSCAWRPQCDCERRPSTHTNTRHDTSYRTVDRTEQSFAIAQHLGWSHPPRGERKRPQAPASARTLRAHTYRSARPGGEHPGLLPPAWRMRVPCSMSVPPSISSYSSSRVVNSKRGRSRGALGLHSGANRMRRPG